MSRLLLVAVPLIVVLALPGCFQRPPPANAPERPSEYSGVPLTDRLLSEAELSAAGWRLLDAGRDEILEPAAPHEIRCNGDLDPGFSGGIHRLRAVLTAAGPPDERGSHKEEVLELVALSDVDELAFGRIAIAIRECDGQKSSIGDELWSPVTHLTEITRGLPAYSAGFEVVISDLDTSQRQWTVVAHGADDTVLIVTTRSSDSEDSFRPDIVEAAVAKFRSFAEP